MKPTTSLLATAAGLATALCIGQARAASHDLVLEAEGSTIDVISFQSGSTQFTQGRLALNGLEAPIEMLQGDTFSAAVTLLDGPLVVPSSPSQVIGFELSGADDPQFDNTPGADVVLSGDITFFLGEDIVHVGGGGCSNCSFVAIFNAPGESFSFDRIEVTGQFLNLTSPYTIASASFNYQLSQPVPEPTTWALWLAGLAVMGSVARRRRAD